jgi:phenylacetyl-CoA:acceptor oxidoreductase subunit 2
MRRDVIGRVAPWVQMSWDWRAAGNFMAGGAGAGLLISASVVAEEAAWLPLALGMALIAGGLLCVWGEIGRPWRALNVFRHAATSWMTREALVALAVFVCGFVVLAKDGSAQRWFLAVGAFAFVYCQGRMLRGAKGIPAWRHPRIVPLIVVTGLTEGAALMLLLGTRPATVRSPSWFALLLALLLVARVLVWYAYRAGIERTGAPNACLLVLQRLDKPLVSADVLAIVFAVASTVVSERLWLGPVAAISALLFGWVLKMTIVTRAAYNQGFALKAAPERGVGGVGPPARPGWDIGL